MSPFQIRRDFLAFNGFFLTFIGKIERFESLFKCIYRVYLYKLHLCTKVFLHRQVEIISFLWGVLIPIQPNTQVMIGPCTNLRLQVDGEESVAGCGHDEGGEAEPDPGDPEHVAHGDLLVRPLAALQRRLADLALRQEGDAQQRHANLRQSSYSARHESSLFQPWLAEYTAYRLFKPTVLSNRSGLQKELTNKWCLINPVLGSDLCLQSLLSLNYYQTLHANELSITAHRHVFPAIFANLFSYKYTMHIVHHGKMQVYCIKCWLTTS